MNSRLEELLNSLQKKEEEKPKNVVLWILAVIGAVAAVAAGGAQGLEPVLMRGGHERRRAGRHVRVDVLCGRGARASGRGQRTERHRDHEGAGNQMFPHSDHPSTFVIETQVFL